MVIFGGTAVDYIGASAIESGTFPKNLGFGGGQYSLGYAFKDEMDRSAVLPMFAQGVEVVLTFRAERQAIITLKPMFLYSTDYVWYLPTLTLPVGADGEAKLRFVGSPEGVSFYIGDTETPAVTVLTQDVDFDWVGPFPEWWSFVCFDVLWVYLEDGTGNSHFHDPSRVSGNSYYFRAEDIPHIREWVAYPLLLGPQQFFTAFTRSYEELGVSDFTDQADEAEDAIIVSGNAAEPRAGYMGFDPNGVAGGTSLDDLVRFTSLPVRWPFSLVLGGLVVWTSIEILRAGTYKFSTGQSESSNLSDTSMALYNEHGLRVAYNEDINGNEDEADYRSFFQVALVPGVYRLAVSVYQTEYPQQLTSAPDGGLVVGEDNSPPGLILAIWER